MKRHDGQISQCWNVARPPSAVFGRSPKNLPPGGGTQPRRLCHIGPLPMRRACGFLLIEVMIVLGLLAVVGVLSAQLFFATLRAVRQSSAGQTAEMRFDLAMNELRTDTWGASEITCDDAHHVQLRTAAGQTVHWNSDGRSLTRTGPKATERQHWTDVAAEGSFAARGPALIVLMAADDPAGQMVLPSQSMLSAERLP